MSLVSLVSSDSDAPALRCYQCNINGFPECPDPFVLETGRLANCSSDRLDNRVELCAKIIGTIVAIDSTTVDGERQFVRPISMSDDSFVSAVVTKDATFGTGMNSSAYKTPKVSMITTSGKTMRMWNTSAHSVSERFFGRGCFPVGEGWVHRKEPYNETFIFGDLTISGSIYICRNNRCNSAESAMTSSNYHVILMHALLFVVLSSALQHNSLIETSART